MKLQQVSYSCFAVVPGNNRACDANSGLINRGGGVVIDTQPDLSRARRMIELFGTVWPGMPKRVINTHEDGDHVGGNQLFAGAEIIAHRSVSDGMRRVADPRDPRTLAHRVDRLLPGLVLRALHPGVRTFARQLRQDFDFAGIEPAFPTTVFDERLVLDLDGLEVHLIHVGPCHRDGDTVVHVPAERVVFAGDIVVRRCTPVGWTGTFRRWLAALDLIIWLEPDAIVPGHGPICGIEGAMEVKAYLEYVCDEARRFFDRGLTPLEASKRIELGPYGEWRAPARLYVNVERAYREFRRETEPAVPAGEKTLDAMYAVAKARGMEVEF